MTPTTAPAPLLTAEEFAGRFQSDPLVELIDGVVEKLPMPGAEHGEIGMTAGAIIHLYVKANGLGRTFGLDTFVRTRTNPDRVRGADFSFLSYARFPKGQKTPKGVLPASPELVIEVVSPTDRPGVLAEKVEEYLAVGVTVVVVLDPGTESATIYRTGDLPQTRHNGDELTVPDVLPGFAVPVKRFFE